MIKEPKMMRTAEPGLLRSSWFLKGGHWTKIEDHVDPSDKNCKSVCSSLLVGVVVFPFHAPGIGCHCGNHVVLFTDFGPHVFCSAHVHDIHAPVGV